MGAGRAAGTPASPAPRPLAAPLTAGPTAAAQLKMCCLPIGPSKLRTPTAPALLMPLDRGAVGASPQARVCGSGTAAHYLARKDPRAAEGSRPRRPTAVWAPRRTAGSWAVAKRGRLPVRPRRGPPSRAGAAALSRRGPWSLSPVSTGTGPGLPRREAGGPRRALCVPAAGRVAGDALFPRPCPVRRLDTARGLSWSRSCRIVSRRMK